MKELTFAFDVQLNDNEDWIPEGTKVQVYDTILQREGSTPVIIDWCKNYTGYSFSIPKEVHYFMNCSFKELIK